MIAYIAAPYAAHTADGIEANILRACRMAERAEAAGYVAVVPHLVLAHRFLHESPLRGVLALEIAPETAEIRAAAMAACLALVRRLKPGTDQIWVASPTITAGMQAEIDLAESRGVEVVVWKQDPSEVTDGR